MGKSVGSVPAVIGIMLVTIFSILSLSVFSVLVLSVYSSGSQLSADVHTHVSDYYAADTQAEEILAALRGGTVPEGVCAAGDGTYSYSCPVDEASELNVVVRVTDSSDFDILTWQLVSTVDWQTDAFIPVWEGDFNF